MKRLAADPEYEKCSSSTSCSLDPSPANESFVEKAKGNKWWMYSIYACLALAVLSLLLYCFCYRSSRTVRRRVKKGKGGSIEVNVSCANNTETHTRQETEIREHIQLGTPDRKRSGSTCSDDESFDWDKYNPKPKEPETCSKRKTHKKSTKKKKRKHRKRNPEIIEESMRTARTLLEEVEVAPRVHRVYMMPALMEVIGLLQEQRRDFEEKEQRVQEQKLQLKSDLEHSKSQIRALQEENAIHQVALRSASINHLDSTSRRRPSMKEMSSLDLDEEQPGDEEELRQQKIEVFRLLNNLREKERELGKIQDEEPKIVEDVLSQSASRVLSSNMDRRREELSPTQPLSPPAEGDSPANSLCGARSFSRITMTGSSCSGSLSDDGRDDIEQQQQQQKQFHPTWSNEYCPRGMVVGETKTKKIVDGNTSMNSTIYFPEYREYYGYE